MALLITIVVASYIISVGVWLWLEFLNLKYFLNYVTSKYSSTQIASINENNIYEYYQKYEAYGQDKQFDMLRFTGKLVLIFPPLLLPLYIIVLIVYYIAYRCPNLLNKIRMRTLKKTIQNAQLEKI